MHPTAVLAEPPGGPLFTTAEGINQADVRRQVAQVADHFRTVNPASPITDPARMATAVLVAGTVGRMRPLLRELPFTDTLPAGTTRRAYADLLNGGGSR